MTKITIYPAPDISTPALLAVEWKSLRVLEKKNRHAAISDTEKSLLEAHKLFLLQQFYQQLLDNCHPGDLAPAAAQQPKQEAFSFKKYFTFLISGLAMNLVHGFVSSLALLSLITALSNPVMLVASGVMSLLNACTYYFFEGYVLKQNLGIPILTKAVQKNLAVYEDQLTLMKKINYALRDAVAVSHFRKNHVYEDMITTAIAMNKSVQANKHLFAKYEEKKSTKTIRLSFMIFGSTMAAGTGFFAAKALLGIVAVSLIGTPLGWGLIAGAAVLSVVFHLGLKPKKMFNMLNPTSQKFKKIQAQFEDFHPQSENDFAKLLRHRSSIVSPITQDMPAKLPAKLKVQPLTRRYGVFDGSIPVTDSKDDAKLIRSASMPLRLR